MTVSENKRLGHVANVRVTSLFNCHREVALFRSRLVHFRVDNFTGEGHPVHALCFRVGVLFSMIVGKSISVFFFSIEGRVGQRMSFFRSNQLILRVTCTVSIVCGTTGEGVRLFHNVFLRLRS